VTTDGVTTEGVMNEPGPGGAGIVDTAAPDLVAANTRPGDTVETGRTIDQILRGQENLSSDRPITPSNLRLSDVGPDVRSSMVDRLTTAGAVRELLGGMAFRRLTPPERIALIDALGQLNETIFRDVAQAATKGLATIAEGMPPGVGFSAWGSVDGRQLAQAREDLTTLWDETGAAPVELTEAGERAPSLVESSVVESVDGRHVADLHVAAENLIDELVLHETFPAEILDGVHQQLDEMSPSVPLASPDLVAGLGHGARGVVALNGNTSGSRVINVENVHGKIRFVDGRLNLVDARPAARSATGLAHLRRDGLPLGQIPSSVELVRSLGTRMQLGAGASGTQALPRVQTSRELSGLRQSVDQPWNEGHPPVPGGVVDRLMGLGHQRLDERDSRESTISRAQDRPALLVLTEGLVGAARQLAVSWPAVPVERSGVPAELMAGADSGSVVAQRLREAGQEVARGLVRTVAAGEGARATSLLLVDDPAGPFGAVTWRSLVEQLQGLAGQEPVVRSGMAEEFLAGVSREFHVAVARWVPSHEWFRRPATGAAFSPGAGSSRGGTAGAPGRDGAGGPGEGRSEEGLPQSPAARQNGRPRPEVDLASRRDRLLAAIVRLDGGRAATPADARAVPAARAGQLVWTPPASWTERLVDRGLRGREFDLVPNAAQVIAAIRGVQEIRLLEHHQLAAIDELSLFLVDELTAPIAGDVARRVLESQAREYLAARLTQWGGEEMQVAGQDLITIPVWERVQAGIESSLQAVLRWADHLGAARAARAELTETELTGTELTEPAEFVRILREASESALRQAEQDLDPADPDAGSAASQLAADLSAVAEAEYDGVWAELARRVTQRSLGAPGAEYSLEAMTQYLDAVLQGEATARGGEGGGPLADQPRVGEPPRGEVRLRVLADRMNTAWGPAGLSENVVHDLLTWYEEFPEAVAETIRALRRAAAGRLSSQQLAELMVLRGQQFLGRGPGLEPWAMQYVRSASAHGSQLGRSASGGGSQTSGHPGAPLPASADVRLLDAGAELMLHDLAHWLGPGGRGARWRGAVAPLTARLYETYRNSLTSLRSPSLPRSTVVSASRSFVAYASPGSELLWALITQTLEAVQTGNVTAAQAIRATTKLLGVIRLAADDVLQQSAGAPYSGRVRDADGAAAEAGRPSAAGPEASRAGKRRAIEDEAGNPIWAGAGATRSGTRSTAVGGPQARAVDAANRETRFARKADGSGRRQLVELIDRRWGRPGEPVASTGDRTLPAYPVITAGTVAALESLVIGARPAEELRHGLLSALARRAGQVVLGTQLGAAEVDPLTADAAAVRLLDVGVQLALHDLEVRAAGTAGGAAPITGQETDPADTGRVAPADLVPLLQQVYRERLEELLAGAAADGEAADAAARSLQLLGDPCVQAAWSDAAARIAAASSRATVSGTATDVPQALLRQVDLRLRPLLEGMPADAPGRYLVTRIAKVVAVVAVHTQLRRGDLESTLGASPDPVDAAALQAAAAAMAVWLYKEMVSQGRERPATAPFLPGVALPGEREAALTEVFAALRGLDVLGATVAGAGLAPGSASALLNALWAVLADNAVHRVVAEASAETRDVARRQLRHYGQTTGVTESQPVPLWHRLAQSLAVPQLRPAMTTHVQTFAREAVRLLWRWAADPSAPVPPRTVAAAMQQGIELSAVGAHRVVRPVSMAAAAWPGRGGPADPGQPVTVPLAEVVPYARVSAPVPARLASEIMKRVGVLLGQLPNDTAGAFEAQLAAAGSVRENFAGFSAVDRAELAPLASALSDALYSSLADFGRTARVQAAGQEPVVVHGAGPMDGVEPADGARPVVADADQAAREALETLPSTVREVLEGLAPAVTRLSVGGWSRNTVIVLLRALRNAVINGVLGAASRIHPRRRSTWPAGSSSGCGRRPDPKGAARASPRQRSPAGRGWWPNSRRRPWPGRRRRLPRRRCDV
jgi:hypothetical protein